MTNPMNLNFFQEDDNGYENINNKALVNSDDLFEMSMSDIFNPFSDEANFNGNFFDSNEKSENLIDLLGLQSQIDSINCDFIEFIQNEAQVTDESNEYSAKNYLSDENSSLGNTINRVDLKSNSSFSLEESKSKKCEKNDSTKKQILQKKVSNGAGVTKQKSKKLIEREKLFELCDLYAKKNNELRKKIEDQQFEINYIKNILIKAMFDKINENI